MKIVSITSPHIYSHTPVRNVKVNTINFSANHSYEKNKGNGIKSINHETYFFREPATDAYIQNYILKNWSDKPIIQIVSGGCSSGEEALSYAMMLDSMKKVDIFGFDIDENSIKKAKEGIYPIRTFEFKFKNQPLLIKDCSENFLINDNCELNEYSKKAKEKFYDYFTPISKKRRIHNKLRITFSLWIINLFHPKKFKAEMPVRYEQKFKVNEEKFKNCHFMQGDILNADKLFQPESINVFLFRNTLYHLICTGDTLLRITKPDAPETVDKIAKVLRKCIVPGGFAVFGEREEHQGVDQSMIYNIMTKNGFEPVLVNSNKAKYFNEFSPIEPETEILQNIWQKR